MRSFHLRQFKHFYYIINKPLPSFESTNSPAQKLYTTIRQYISYMYIIYIPYIYYILYRAKATQPRGQVQGDLVLCNSLILIIFLEILSCNSWQNSKRGQASKSIRFGQYVRAAPQCKATTCSWRLCGPETYVNNAQKRQHINLIGTTM